MGTQQILMIIVGVVVVGIAVVVGLNMVGQQTASANLDAVINDLNQLASTAHAFYTKPERMGGGGRTFIELTADAAGVAKLTADPTNDNGTYSISTAGTAAQVVLQGIGQEDGDGDGTAVTVRMWVRADATDDSLVVVNR